MRYFATIVVSGLLCGPAAWATEFNDKTTCDALSRAVNARDVMDIRRSNQYIRDIFQSLDHAQASAGHQTLVNLLSATDMRAMVWEVVTECASKPTFFVRSVAGAVYIVSSAFGAP